MPKPLIWFHSPLELEGITLGWLKMKPPVSGWNTRIFQEWSPEIHYPYGFCKTQQVKNHLQKPERTYIWNRQPWLYGQLPLSIPLRWTWTFSDVARQFSHGEPRAAFPTWRPQNSHFQSWSSRHWVSTQVMCRRATQKLAYRRHTICKGADHQINPIHFVYISVIQKVPTPSLCHSFLYFCWSCLHDDLDWKEYALFILALS